MSRFNSRRSRALAPSAPLTTTGARTTTYEGGAAYVRDAKSELFLLAVVNMVGQRTFYEAAGDRDARYRDLVRRLAVEDPVWTAGLLGWLRGSAQMRTASLVGAAEFVRARLDAGLTGHSRQVVDSVLQRPDEPGELLGYWTRSHGRALPKPVKRGVADAVRRLYHARSLLKYDTASKDFRFGDVLNLVHASPDPAKPWQGELFRYALDRRHHPETAEPPAADATLTAHRELAALPAGERRALLLSPQGPQRLARAGMTWEALAGWLQGPMDAAAWEAIIPSMGLMALTRNLRNFDEAGVSDAVAEQVAARLADPQEVRRSRQFPYRFLSAYRMVPSGRWTHALERALAASTANVPALPGRTLVLVDTSGSMLGQVSAKSMIRHVDVGALFGVALAARGCEVDLWGFADRAFRHPLERGGPVLPQTEAFCARVGEVGYGTETVAALREAYDGHDRVVIVSDMQAFAYPGHGAVHRRVTAAPPALVWGPRGWQRKAGTPAQPVVQAEPLSVSDAIPADVPLFGIDTTGYAPASLDTGAPHRYEIGGFSDQLFTMVDLLSRGLDAGWPWGHRSPA
ncbi:TROVE domain-containing protein [Streptomyces sp. enrichment culture]|uniref:vWA domain-containing protein n=1 Tax=Streptomyces sp. enrichment culture TaxID=1795815 RepID=UPI003F550C70